MWLTYFKKNKKNKSNFATSKEIILGANKKYTFYRDELSVSH